VIILDTNVISALMRREPDRVVVEWLDARPAESFWTTSISIFEVRFGIEILSPGRRREMLERFWQASGRWTGASRFNFR
jgi:predicted nucleic acid-binding protein